MKIKILVVSCTPWRNDNSVGNSYTNIFKGIDNIEIAHICCGGGVPETDFVKRHFHINEKRIIENIFNNNIKTGIEINDVNNVEVEEINNIKNDKSLFNFMRIHRFQIFFWIRDFIWSFKNWKSPELKAFVDSFQPNIIFAPFLDSKYLNEMIIFLHEYIKKPVVVYGWDDVYTLKQFSVSPFYWINKFYQRSKLKKIADISSIMYTISKIQQEEYSNIFSKNCNILYKGYEFIEYPKADRKLNSPIQLVFTGNITSGRWKSLSKIGNALHEINKEFIKAQLIIYTHSPLSKKMKRALKIKDSVLIKPAISNNKVARIQQEADILVHAESFDLKEKLQVRMSFSTKLVDYFNNARCIFAVGSEDVASIDYLISNDAAIVCKNEDEIIKKLTEVIEKPELIHDYSKKSWECGKKNHKIDEIQEKLYNDLKSL
ncbi:Uncharacterised protein [[Clostridium] sordellii]|uniref:glycosyltransferase n=1 Tax=Paraclostridium sordellii TaxID=1505 RepID=UPI0005DFE68C|nr:glycosyltransferase [Paeniclostridium sordellii]CEN76504.1 Uncharacterised protein [[Clostridium] sordellii] [Paeniclostridium sordellii]